MEIDTTLPLHTLEDSQESNENINAQAIITLEEPIAEGKAQKESLMINYVTDRIKQNKNFLAVCVGRTGSGKTFSMLRFAEMLDPEFNVSRVCFTAQEFITCLRDKTLKSGNVIVFDEQGIAQSSRDWQSTQNKLLNFITQVFRYRNLIVLYTVPDLSFVDVQSRKLMHMMFETVGISHRRKLVFLKPFVISISKRTGKIYYVYPRFKGPNGAMRLTRMQLKLPSIKLRHAYEKRKFVYGESLIKDAEAQLAAQESLKIVAPTAFKRKLSPQEEKVYSLKTQMQMNNEEIAFELGTTPKMIKAMLGQAELKGHVVPREKKIPEEVKNAISKTGEATATYKPAAINPTN